MYGNNSLAQLRQDYEIWYSESYAVIKIILPDRILDFSKMYYEDKIKKGLKIHFQYTPPIFGDIDFSPKEVDVAKSVFDSQIGIAKSCKKKFESSLFDIKQLLQADIFDSELDASKELNKKGFFRGAGAIAGVILESHLSQVCHNHNIKVNKKNLTINYYNDLLKSEGIFSIELFRHIQLLGDLRNKCDHKKSQDPTKQNIEDLINGVEKIIKTKM